VLRRRARSAVVVAAALAALGAPRATRAQTPDAPRAHTPLGEELQGPARAAYEEGRTLFRSGDFAAAYARFETAYAASSNPRLLWNMGACEEQLRHYARAIAVLERYLASDRIDDEARARGRALLAQMNERVGHVRVETQPEGANVFVDDIAVADVARPLPVDEGEHTVRAEKDGYRAGSAAFRASAGGEERVRVVLEAEGRLVVRAPAGAALSVDGEVVVVGPGGEWGAWLPVGAHAVAIRTGAGDRSGAARTVVLSPLASTTVDLSARPRRLWPWFVGAGAAVIAGLAVGGYFAFKPEDKRAPQPAGNLGGGLVFLSR
jgi:hypothetical protein